MSMIAFKMKYMSFIFMGREIQMIIDEAVVDHDGLIDYIDHSCDLSIYLKIILLHNRQRVIVQIRNKSSTSAPCLNCLHLLLSTLVGIS